MRKSTIAGLTLTTALLAFAGQSHADDPAKGPVIESASLKASSAKPVRSAHKQPSPIAETPKPLFRIPAYPVVRDCVHVFFPQCSRGYESLNDGTFGKY